MENRDDIRSLTTLLAMVALKGLGERKIRKITEGEARSLAAHIKELTGQTISPRSLINYFKAAESEDWMSINPSMYTLDILAKYGLNGSSGMYGRELPSDAGLYWLKFKQNETASAVSPRPAGRLKIRGIFWVTLFILLGIPAAWLILKPSPTDFRDTFDHVSLDALQDSGWAVLDLDTLWLKKQPMAGHLTLYTLHGDYWTKPHETPYVRNTLVRKIKNPREWDIFLNLTDFKPNGTFQQVGLVFFETPQNKQRVIRYTLCYTMEEQLDCFYPKKYAELLEIKNGLVEAIKSTAVHNRPDGHGNLESHDVCLRVQFTEGKFIFSFQAGDTYQGFTPIKEHQSTLKPKYVGIFAFQGQTDFSGKPFNSDTIPAFINDFSICYHADQHHPF